MMVKKWLELKIVTHRQTMKLAGEAGASPQQGTSLSDSSDSSSDSDDDQPYLLRNPPRSLLWFPLSPTNLGFEMNLMRLQVLLKAPLALVLMHLLEDADKLGTQEAEFTPTPAISQETQIVCWWTIWSVR